MKKAIFLFLLLFPSFLIAQTDHALWSSIQLQKNLSEKTALNIKPFFRFNENISSYQNSSIDLIVKHKLNKGWSVQLLNRFWMIPDQSYRHFIWADLALSKTIGKIKLDNTLRYHWGLDINDRNDPDYLRWSAKFSLLSKGKITPYVAIEPWLRTNSINKFQRIRYEPGFIWKLNARCSLTTQYRIEESINLRPKQNFNVIMFNLLYKI